MWNRLKQWYGARLADQYGDVPPPDWCDVIDRHDDERLETALFAVRRESPIHPPTLGQLEAAIPAKRLVAAGPNAAEQLVAHVMATIGAQLCEHQIGSTWNYFGPLKEFVSTHRGDEVVTQPDVRGVQIPACTACEKPTHRALLEDVTTQGVAA